MDKFSRLEDTLNYRERFYRAANNYEDEFMIMAALVRKDGSIDHKEEFAFITDEDATKSVEFIEKRDGVKFGKPVTVRRNGAIYVLYHEIVQEKKKDMSDVQLRLWGVIYDEYLRDF